ncbi:MAG: class B sortase [Lachnospiraceae bacterium]|nr:class B sortase [Lachnospiraceae bacterium]
MAEMRHLNKLNHLSQKRIGEKGKSCVTYGCATLLLVVSMMISGCDFPGSEKEEPVLLESTEISTSESTEESSEESIIAKVETDQGVVELVTVESADPYEELEPEDLPIDGQSLAESESEEPSEESIPEETSIEATSVETQPEETQPEETPAPTPAPAPQAPSADAQGRIIDFATLQATVNSDIYAWIYVPGTNVDYPVLRHPSDDGYYLMHNLDHSYGYPGCIYSENCNSKTWGDPLTVLYGHDMRSTSTMFHQLHKFEKQDFFDKHEYFYVYTPEKTLTYRIFASHVHTNEHVIGNHNFYNEDEFNSYFANVMAVNTGVNHIRAGVTIASGNKIVLLSTCIKNQPNNRWHIYGVLVE